MKAAESVAQRRFLPSHSKLALLESEREDTTTDHSSEKEAWQGH